MAEKIKVNVQVIESCTYIAQIELNDWDHRNIEALLMRDRDNDAAEFLMDAIDRSNPHRSEYELVDFDVVEIKDKDHV